jgi:hypothetical protein
MPPLPIAAALIVLGSLVCLANGWTALQRHRTGRFRSTVPLVGAALLGTGLFFVPVTHPFCWVALVLDYGTVELLLALPKVFGEFWGTSRFNLVAEYYGQAGGKTVRLRLFRRAVFTLRLRIQRPPGECGLMDAGTIGTWQRDGARLTLRADGGEAIFEVLGTAPAESLRQTVGFPAWANSPDRSLDGMELFPPNQRPNPRAD